MPGGSATLLSSGTATRFPCWSGGTFSARCGFLLSRGRSRRACPWAAPAGAGRAAGDHSHQQRALLSSVEMTEQRWIEVFVVASAITWLETMGIVIAHVALRWWT